MPLYGKDLVVLVADRNIEYAIKGLLERPRALRIRSVGFNIYKHPENDPGCRSHGVDFLRPFANQYHHALLVFDKAGCGREAMSRSDIENRLEIDLSAAGWGSRAATVVIDPEVENWVWSDSPHVDSVLGWEGKQPPLRSWLLTQGFLSGGGSKPSQPKEAMDAALRQAQIPHSSSLFLQIAKRVSFERCDDPAFLKLKTTLTAWFPSEQP